MASLEETFPRWNVSTTPGGAWVARRKRHMTLTNSRIDAGIRDCLIERSEDDLRKQLENQERIESEMSGTNAT